MAKAKAKTAWVITINGRPNRVIITDHYDPYIDKLLNELRSARAKDFVNVYEVVYEERDDLRVNTFYK